MPFTMERREHYDPEDIERLLQERGFDELLEEERAYVLRHLDGRDEYEAMRALLLQVRADDAPPVQAGEDVRDQVMRAYRQEHRPRWEIWLNSLGALMRPQQGAAMPWLRPTFTLGSLAVLIVAGVWVARHAGGDEAPQPLAELKAKPVNEKPAAPGAATTTQPQEASSNEARRTMTAPAEAANRAPALSEPARTSTGAAESMTTMLDAIPMDAEVAEDAPRPNAKDRDEPMTLQQERDRKHAEPAAPARDQAATRASHVVTEGELMRNYSTANATGKVAVAQKNDKGADLSPSLSQTPEVLALVTAGW